MPTAARAPPPPSPGARSRSVRTTSGTGAHARASRRSGAASVGPLTDSAPSRYGPPFEHQMASRFERTSVQFGGGVKEHGPPRHGRATAEAMPDRPDARSGRRTGRAAVSPRSQQRVRGTGQHGTGERTVVSTAGPSGEWHPSPRDAAEAARRGRLPARAGRANTSPGGSPLPGNAITTPTTPPAPGGDRPAPPPSPPGRAAPAHRCPIATAHDPIPAGDLRGTPLPPGGNPCTLCVTCSRRRP